MFSSSDNTAPRKIWMKLAMFIQLCVMNTGWCLFLKVGTNNNSARIQLEQNMLQSMQSCFYLWQYRYTNRQFLFLSPIFLRKVFTASVDTIIFLCETFISCIYGKSNAECL